MCVNNPKEPTRKLLMSSANLQDTSSIYKNQLYFYIPANKQSKNEILKTSFIIALKRTKMLRNKLSKMQNLCSVYYKHYQKELKKM